MGIEILMVILAATLFGGIVLALATGAQERRLQTQAARPAAQQSLDAPEFFGVAPVIPPMLPDEALVLQIERVVHQEISKAQQFADNPSLETLQPAADNLSAGLQN